MISKPGAIVVGGCVLAVLAFALWNQQRYPRVIEATSHIRVASPKQAGASMMLETRVVRIADIRFEEVRRPNGTWIGCAGDCRKAALDAGPDFWDAQARR